MKRLGVIAFAALLLALSGIAAESQAQCVSDSEGHQLVAQGEVLTLPSALQRAGLSDAKILDAQLCKSGGGWSYRVRYRKAGQVSSANIPAG